MGTEARVVNDRTPRREEGKEVAFEHLYAAHHRAVLAYCARRALKWDAWDAAAEVFLVAWRRMDDVPAGDQARAWLYGVAYRTLANQRRTARRKHRLAERAAGTRDIAVPTPDEVVVRNEEAVEVVDALARLKPAEREILRLYQWEELAPPDIATVLGISRAAVDQRYARAKRRLARELTGHHVVSRRATRITTGKGGVT